MTRPPAIMRKEFLPYVCSLLLGSYLINLDQTVAQTARVRIPLSVFDASHHRATAYFGVDPVASYCVDPTLQEFLLPPDHCFNSSPCIRFIDSRDGDGQCLSDGLLLDLRRYFSPTQVDTYRVAFSAQDYPVIFRWPAWLRDFYDGARITDIFGGTFYSADMLTEDSLVLLAPDFSLLQIVAWNPHGVTTSVREHPDWIPRQPVVLQNFPNPFNPATTFYYTLETESEVNVRIYDLLGVEIATLVSERQHAGLHRIEWNAGRLPSGVYVGRLDIPGRSSFVKLVVAR